MVLRNTEKKSHEKRNKQLRATLILRPFTLQTSQPVAPDLQSPGQKRRLGPLTFNSDPRNWRNTGIPITQVLGKSSTEPPEKWIVQANISHNFSVFSWAMAQKHQQFSLARMKYDPLTIHCSGVLRPGSIRSRSDVFIPQTTLNGQKTWIPRSNYSGKYGCSLEIKEKPPKKKLIRYD